jgi:predicted transcriptional regulator
MLPSKRTILHVLFPEVRAKVLQALFASRAKPRYVRELSLITRLALHTIQDELRKLAAANLVIGSTNGFRRFYRANRGHPLFNDLCHIVSVSETVPRINRAALKRRPSRSRRKSGVAKTSGVLRPERIHNWHLLSKPYRDAGR